MTSIPANYDPQKDLEEGTCTSPPHNGAYIGAYTRTSTSVSPALLPSPALLALYPGSCISEATGTLLLRSLAAKHRLTRSAMGDILQVLTLHMPENTAPMSYASHYRLFGSVRSSSRAHIVHQLCGGCGGVLSGSVLPVVTASARSNVITFYELPIETQLQALFNSEAHTSLFYDL